MAGQGARFGDSGFRIFGDPKAKKHTQLIGLMHFSCSIWGLGSSSCAETFLLTCLLFTESHIHAIFEPKTGTWQYVVADPITAIIDSVLDMTRQPGSCQ